MTTPTFNRNNTPALNIRIRAEQRALIEQAARIADKTVSDFVRDASLSQAQNTLLDQTLFPLGDDDWEAFNDALDAAPAHNPRLEELLSRKPVWEK